MPTACVCTDKVFFFRKTKLQAHLLFFNLFCILSYRLIAVIGFVWLLNVNNRVVGDIYLFVWFQAYRILDLHNLTITSNWPIMCIHTTWQITMGVSRDNIYVLEISFQNDWNLEYAIGLNWSLISYHIHKFDKLLATHWLYRKCDNYLAPYGCILVCHSPFKFFELWALIWDHPLYKIYIH